MPQYAVLCSMIYSISAEAEEPYESVLEAGGPDANGFTNPWPDGGPGGITEDVVVYCG